MNENIKLIYPWRWQIVCLVIAISGSIAYLLLVPLDASFCITTPVLVFGVSLIVPFILAMVLIAVMPALSFKHRRKALHETASVCGRCEKELLPGSTIARFGSEFLCEECTKHMEDIQGEELTKFNKPEGM